MHKTNRFRITGISEYEIWFTSSLNPLLENSTLTSASGYSGSSSRRWQYNNEEIEVNVPEDANYIIFNFTNTDELAPKVEAITETIEGGTTDYEELNNKPQINGVTLIGNKSFEDLGLVISKSYEELTNYVEDYYYPSFFDEDVFIGDEIPQPEEFINSSFIVIDKQNIPSTSFRVTGDSVSQIWFTCSDNPTLATSILRSVGTSGTPQEPVHYRDTEITIDVPSNANFIVFNFTNTNEVTPKVEVISESITAPNVKNLTSNLIILSSTELDLDTGFYNTNLYNVYIGSQTSPNLLCSPTTLFYFDKESQEFITPFESLYFDTNTWTRMQNGYIENTLTDNRNKLPTSQAVYNAIQNISPASVFYNVIDEDITFNQDGTTTPEIENGYYYIKNHQIKYYQNSTLNEPIELYNVIFYYSKTAKHLNAFTINSGNIIVTLDYNSYSQYWFMTKYDSSSFVHGLIGSSSTSYLTDTINSSSPNSDVPTVNAIKNYIENYSTSEKLIGKWIDGKPLYQKIIYGNTPNVTTDGTNVTQTFDVSDENVDVCFIANSFIAYQGQFNSVWTCPYTNSSGRSIKTQIALGSNNYKRVQVSSDGTIYNNSIIYNIVKYTKTTD